MSSNANQSVSVGGNVIVVCRFRPLNRKEKEMGTVPCVEFGADKKGLSLKCA
jgi:hypothetical protein